MAADISRDTEAIRAHLKEAKTIAVVGLSPDSYKPSHGVSAYMQRAGYRIIPVNPKAEGRILGEEVYPDLLSVPDSIHIDIIDVFRRSVDIYPVAEQALKRPAPLFWMQMGISNAEAAARLIGEGVDVIQDRCLKIEHAALLY